MPSHVAELCALDQVIPAVETAAYIVFKTDDAEAAVAKLHEGIKQTVKQLPFLTGTICEDDDDFYKAKISWNDDTPELPFVEVPGTDLPSYGELAEKGMTLHTLPFDFRPPALRDAMTADKKPAAILSYTKIRGGIIVLLALHHQLTDGGGRSLLLNLLANNTRGSVDSAVKISPLEPTLRVDLVKKLAEAAPKTPSSGEGATGNARSAERVFLPADTSVPTSEKLFQFSVDKLNRLRHALAQHTKSSFSLNVLLNTLLWSALSTARAKRVRKADPKFPLEECYTELCIAVNPRQRIEEKNFLEKDSYFGNLLVGVAPRPRAHFSSFLEGTFSLAPSGPKETGIEAGASASAGAGLDNATSSGIPCPKVIPELIDQVSTGLAGVSAESTLASWAALHNIFVAMPELDRRMLRNWGVREAGTNFIVTSWAGLDLFPDFGLGLGRPTYSRKAEKWLQEGLCAVQPRHFGHVEAALLDRLDLYLTLREDDMQEVLQDELIRSVLVAPPV